MNTPANTSAKTYRHTQFGTVIVCSVLPVAVFLLALGLLKDRHFVVPGLITLLVTWLFHSLTIEVNYTHLCWSFGPGLIRKRVPLADLKSADPVESNFFEGWGIHLSRFGWLYNVSGYGAVAITRRNGRPFALGTDEPQALCAVLLKHAQPHQV